MNIQYVSDLHLEFSDNFEFNKLNPITVNGDVLIMAGDIVPFVLIEQNFQKYKFFFDTISKFRQVYWLPGNHEYYNYEITGRIGTFHKDVFPNIRLLNNTVVTLPGVRILFSTLWSKIEKENAETVYNNLRDFQVIRYDLGHFFPYHYNKLFVQNLSFLKSALSVPFDGKTIVVTHHVPTLQHYPEEYAFSHVNNAFATELDVLIKESDIDVWIYGHHHRNVPDFYIGKTLLTTNQLGYVRHNECPEFNPSKYLSL